MNMFASLGELHDDWTMMRQAAAAQLLLLAVHGVVSETLAPPLHIVLMLVDELGTGDLPWSDPEMHAPMIKELGEGGLRLGHQYAWHWCAPTRSALMSGRLPMHSGYKLSPASGSQPHSAVTNHLLS
jgi:hypothetical protein